MHFFRRMLKVRELHDTAFEYSLDRTGFFALSILSAVGIALYWPSLALYGDAIARISIALIVPGLYICFRISFTSLSWAAALLSGISMGGILISVSFVFADNLPLAIQVSMLFPAIIAGSFLSWKHGITVVTVQSCAIILLGYLQGGFPELITLLYHIIASTFLLVPLFMKSAVLHASITIAQYRHTHLLHAYDDMIAGLSAALELRDDDTGLHSKRVVQLTLELAYILGITDSRNLRLLRWGAYLHDIGKIGIPDHILLKAGPLTDTEWVIMRQHPTLGAKILSHIDYLHEAIPIPLMHHERWDGSGYPAGLRGEQIPLSARIFAVVDVYDALTQPRPYRSTTLSIEEVCDYLTEQAGVLFDPACVVPFCELLRIRHSFQDR